MPGIFNLLVHVLYVFLVQVLPNPFRGM